MLFITLNIKSIDCLIIPDANKICNKNHGNMFYHIVDCTQNMVL